MFSIVCVYNNKEILNEWLLNSLGMQNVKDYELIILDNTKGQFKSAAEALNVGGKKAKGSYIMFVHQDLKLIDGDWLRKAERYVESIGDLGIAGIAGMSNFEDVNGERGRNVIFHGTDRKPWGNPISAAMEVQTLDEQLLIIPRNVFDVLKFDEISCNGWHLYGVDYALSVGNLGLKAYVLPLSVWHWSMGSPLDQRYFHTVRKIAKKHKHIKMIYTPPGYWPNNSFYLCLLEIGLYRIIWRMPRRLISLINRLMCLAGQSKLASNHK